MSADAKTERILTPSKGLLSLSLEECWRFRELFVSLAWRDILLRYKQTYRGVAWAVLQPLLTMVVFTVVFGRFGKVETLGASHEVMTMAAFAPWWPGFFLSLGVTLVVLILGLVYFRQVEKSFADIV